MGTSGTFVVTSSKRIVLQDVLNTHTWAYRCPEGVMIHVRVLKTGSQSPDDITFRRFECSISFHEKGRSETAEGNLRREHVHTIQTKQTSASAIVSLKHTMTPYFVQEATEKWQCAKKIMFCQLGSTTSRILKLAEHTVGHQAM